MAKISLRKNMIIWIWGVTALIFVLIIGLNFIYSRRTLEKETEKSVTNLARYYGKRLDVVFSQASVIPEVIAAYLESEYEDSEPNREEVLKKFLRRVARANPFIYGVCVAFEPYTFNDQIEYFAPYYYYNEEGEVVYEQLGDDEKYSYFNWGWYTLPREKGKPLWVGPYTYSGPGEVIMTTYSYPVFWNKRFIGVAEVDISLDRLKKDIDELKVLQTGYGFMLSAGGVFLSYPDKSKIMHADISALSSVLADKIKQFGVARSGEWLLVKTKEPFRNERAWVVLRPVRDAAKTLVGIVGFVYPEKEIYADIYALERNTLFWAVSGLFVLLLIIVILSGSISRPISRLAGDAVKLVQGGLDYRISVNAASFEVEALQTAFNRMSDDLRQYVEDLRETTAAKERIESELEIASHIQSSMLPRIFPPFPERKELEIFAMMDPAKEVGGDFYDFFFIDEEKLCFLIADVSGKGVPAALFMAITKSLLKTTALNGLPVDRVLGRVNKILYPDNDESMFVTVFCALMDITTGEIEFANAGHNPPLIGRWKEGACRDFEFIGMHKNFVLAVQPDVEFAGDKTTLYPGDMIFLYTDGVTEAMDGAGKQFSEAGLKAALSCRKEDSVEPLVKSIRGEIESFVKGTAQSDDITMVAIKFNGRGN